MLKFKIFIYFLMWSLCINLANAAIIHGTVYDLSLKKIDDARVEIDTLPKQFIIAQNGSYSFNVPNGAYTIKAQLIQKNTAIASTQENITIKQDGSYVLDLILFPDIEEGIEDIDIDVSENIVESPNNKNEILIGVIVSSILIITLVVLYYFKNQKGQVLKKKKEEKYEDNSLEGIVNFIKKEGGRTTQKDIRKQIPLSEAKISLMIAELEHKGIIEKIKKGRGNIIILKKR